MCISSGRPRRRYQEEIRGGNRRWQGAPSACDASLAPVKGEGEGRRAGEEEPSTRAQFQERFSQDNVGKVIEPKASSRKSPVLYGIPPTITSRWLGVAGGRGTWCWIVKSRSWRHRAPHGRRSEDAFSWPPQLVNLGQAIISRDMEWTVSAFLFPHFGVYYLSVIGVQALGVFAEASSGGSRRMSTPWGWEAWS